MEKDVTQSADFYRLVAWLDKNRKQIVTVTVAVLAVAAIIGGYIWYKNAHEDAAAQALSNLKAPTVSQENPVANPADAQPYLALARQYPGTRAAGRALLVAGGIYFDAGKFQDAQTTFEQFLHDYPEDILASQAQVGVASSLEAQGKLAEATSRYEDLVKRHQADSTSPQAKSALGRLYAAQNQPERAMQYYQELARANNNDTWSAEAGIQIQELFNKYPQLRKAAAPSSSSPPGAISVPGAQ
jgi:tetratricopeptide (TPR) repeat protein